MATASRMLQHSSVARLAVLYPDRLLYLMWPLPAAGHEAVRVARKPGCFKCTTESRQLCCQLLQETQLATSAVTSARAERRRTARGPQRSRYQHCTVDFARTAMHLADPQIWRPKASHSSHSHIWLQRLSRRRMCTGLWRCLAPLGYH